MNWLVVWFLLSQVQTGCPDNSPNPYTGKYNDFVCSVYHTRTVAEFKHRCFETEGEANAFIEKAPKEVKVKMHLISIKDDGIPKNYSEIGSK